MEKIQLTEKQLLTKINSLENSKKLKPFLRKYLESLESTTQVDALTALLKAVDFTKFKTFPHICQLLIKSVCKLWATHPESQIKIVSFLALTKIHQMMPSSLPKMIKLAYFHYQANSKLSNIHTKTNIQFLKSSMVELLQVDPEVSYAIAFVAIRHLTLQLRNAISLKTKEARKSVFSWTFLHSVELWAEYLSVCDDANVRQLVYPLTQVILGSYSKYFPYQRHCLQTLTKLSSSTGTYIPLFNQIIEILQGKLFVSAKPSTMKAVNMDTILKFPKEYAEVHPCAVQTAEAVVGILYEQLELCIKYPGFGELLIPLVIQLKKLKTNKYLRNQIHSMLELIKKHGIEVRKQKSELKVSDIRVDSELTKYIQNQRAMNKFLQSS